MTIIERAPIVELQQNEQRDLARAVGLAQLYQATFPEREPIAYPTKDTISNWADIILANWVEPTTIQSYGTIEKKLSIIESRLKEIVSGRAREAYSYSALSDPLVKVVELAKQTHNVEVFKLVMQALVKSKLHAGQPYGDTTIDPRTIIQESALLKAVKMHEVLGIPESSLGMAMATITLNDVEALCKMIEQQQLVQGWIRFFALGVNSNFYRMSFDGQVQDLAKKVFGSKNVTGRTTDEVIRLLNTEMRKETSAKTDFWTSTASDVVYPD